MEKNHKWKVALVTGGFSGEAAISYKSADTVFKHLDRDAYHVYWIDIRPAGWFCKLDEATEVPIDKRDFTIEGDNGKVRFDVVLMCLHGTPGEDGKLQGYFDLIGLPYTSCDAAISALTFNKRFTVAVAGFAGVNVAKSVLKFRSGEIGTDAMEELRYPLFVKPNNGGSSLGISKVDRSENLMAALEKAFEVDDQVLVEEAIVGREFTVGVFKAGGNVTILPITEIISQNEFFDFEAKYLGKSEEITPAQLTDEEKRNMESAARRVYSALGCRGVVRIDFILESGTGLPHLLEVNTVPGQSAASIIPQQVVASGMDLRTFYSLMVNEALSRTP